MASTFKIIQQGKQNMRLTICLQKTLGNVFNDVGIYGTIYLGSKKYDYNIHATDNNRCFSYELDESYESEIGKDIEPDIFNCTLNGQDVNITKIEIKTPNSDKVTYDNMVEFSFDENIN